jgi:hypothetical protein
VVDQRPDSRKRGFNLYGFVGNGVVNAWNRNGLSEYPIYHKNYKNIVHVDNNNNYIINVDDRMARDNALDPRYFGEMPLSDFADAVRTSKGDTGLLAALIARKQYSHIYARYKVTKEDCGCTAEEKERAQRKCRGNIIFQSVKKGFLSGISGFSEGVVSAFGMLVAFSGNVWNPPLTTAGVSVAGAFALKSVKDFSDIDEAMNGYSQSKKYCDCNNLK